MSRKLIKQGFTIVEALISIFILSIIIIIIMTNFSTSSTHREDIRYFQSRLNISNRMEIVDSIKSSLASENITLKTDYTINDVGYDTIFNGNREYVINCNYYPLSVQGSEVFLTYIDNLPSTPAKYARNVIEGNATVSKQLPTITLADTLIYAGFYVRVGTDTETNVTSIASTFYRNIDTVDVLHINDTIFNNFYINKNLKYDNIHSMSLMHTTNETTEYTRELDILNKKTLRGE